MSVEIGDPIKVDDILNEYHNELKVNPTLDVKKYYIKLTNRVEKVYYLY